MEIRRVHRNDDFNAIGNIYAASWKTAYRGIVPQHYLDELDGSRWSKILEGSQYDAFLVLDRDKYVGTSSVCPARDESLTGWGELVSLYLLPEYFGKGYARPLFDYVVNALAQTGFRDIYLWVLDENIRARRFYEKQGFQVGGDTAAIAIGGKELIEVRYIRHI